MKIRNVLLMIITATVLVMSGCKEEPKTKLVVFAYGDESTPEGQAFERNITKFIADNPNIEVEWDMMFEELYHNRFGAMLSGGEQVDVASVFNGGSRHTKVLESGQAIDQREFVNEADFYEGALNGGGKNGELWAIPFAKSVHTVFYANDDLLNELGLEVAATYDDLLAQKEAAAAAGKTLIAYPAASSWCNDTFIYSVLVGRFAGVQGTVDLYTGKTKFNEGASLKALNFIKKMFDDGIFNETTLQSDYGVSLAQFNNSEALYMIDGGWRAAGVTLTNFSWNKFPAVPGEVAPGSGNGGFSAAGWAILKSATEDPVRKAAAIKLLNYLSGEEASLVRAEVQGTVPAWKVKGPVKYKAGTEVQGEYIANLDYVTQTVGDKLNSAIKDVYMNGIIEIGLGTKTPQEVADATQKAFEENN